MEQNITTLKLPIRVINVLARAKVMTLGELLALSKKQLEKLNHMGEGSIKTINEYINSIGYKTFDELTLEEQEKRIKNAKAIQAYRTKEKVLRKLQKTREDISDNNKTFKFKFSDPAYILTDETFIQEFFAELGIVTLNDLLKRSPFYLHQSFLAKSNADAYTISNSEIMWKDLTDNISFFRLKFDNSLTAEELEERNQKREDPNAYIDDKVNAVVLPALEEVGTIEPENKESLEQLKNENDNLSNHNDDLEQANEELKNEINRKKELLKQYKKLLEENERLKLEEEQLDQEIDEITNLHKINTKRYVKTK